MSYPTDADWAETGYTVAGWVDRLDELQVVYWETPMSSVSARAIMPPMPPGGGPMPAWPTWEDFWNGVLQAIQGLGPIMPVPIVPPEIEPMD